MEWTSTDYWPESETSHPKMRRCSNADSALFSFETDIDDTHKVGQVTQDDYGATYKIESVEKIDKLYGRSVKRVIARLIAMPRRI